MEDLLAFLPTWRWTSSTLKAVTDDLTSARNRLLPPGRLYQVAALLNMPNLEETVSYDDHLQTRRQAALYAGIANWARLSARAAEQLGESDFLEVADRFVYLVEYTEQHAKDWHQAPSELSQGIVMADSAEMVARNVLAQYISHLAEHHDDYQLWLVDSLSLRASVWHMDTAEAHRRDLPANCSLAWHTFKRAGIFPHAIEVRTPSQIRQIMEHHIARTGEPTRNDDLSD
ncbi:hypothetical protein [Nonomuraea sp. SBT364]|uniref:hypothetical protein n=1 Tax=Nonomuraea sp. SBT364 TaxID=1580530 RepID=UPI00066C2FA4|nr:hypothetical protein [Nonomuraea sp. SBT364]